MFCVCIAGPLLNVVQPCPFDCMHTCDRQIRKRSSALTHPAFMYKASTLQQHPTHAELLDRLRAEKLPWTELMDRAMTAAHEEQGATAADVQAACAKVPMHPRMQEASEPLATSVLYTTSACMCIKLSSPTAIVYARNSDQILHGYMPGLAGICPVTAPGAQKLVSPHLTGVYCYTLTFGAHQCS